jgi:hypothetical protein
MEEFKRKIKEIKRLSISLSLDDSQRCWELFPRKNKGRYNECALEATLSFHVFNEGKRKLNEAKNRGLAECEKKLEPVAFKTCMEDLYKGLTQEIPGLEQWILRERKNIDWLKY